MLKPPIVKFTNILHSAMFRMISAAQGSDYIQVSQACDIVVIRVDSFNLEIIVQNFSQPFLLFESLHVYQRWFRTNSVVDKTSRLTVRDVSVLPSETVMMYS